MPRAEQVRRLLFVEPSIQIALVVRVALYWLAGMMTAAMMLLCWEVISGPPKPFYWHLQGLLNHYGPAVLASAVLVPLLMVDVTRLSNRFVGPLVRLRRALKALGQDDVVAPIHFREDDFLQELADEFNAALERVIRRQELLAGGEPSPDFDVGPDIEPAMDVEFPVVIEPAEEVASAV